MAVTSIELQVISRILTSQSDFEIDRLCEYDISYYDTYKNPITFILEHKMKYGNVPDIFTFNAKFPEIPIVEVKESTEYLRVEMCKHRRLILLREAFNKIKDLGADDVDSCWEYLENQCEIAASLDTSKPMDLVSDALDRAEQVLKYSNQKRIPTGFPEIDKCMYGGLSTVEELLIIVARTNTGKSWICTKMMESAQKNGFPVLYYSPEMQASYLGTRFDTWRSHFKNSDLFLGKYDEMYMKYLKELSKTGTSAFVLEDKDVSNGIVSITNVEAMVKRYGIKLLIIDGLSYMTDIRKASNDSERYRNICNDLFRISKKYGCAVVVAMQANRESKETKDEKGLPFPGLDNIEGSDHPARIATQVFAVRQIFEKKVLDIRMEKARNANNQKPVFSYSWDPNTGNVQYLSEGDSGVAEQTGGLAPAVNIQNVLGKSQNLSSASIDDDTFDDDEVEF